MDLQPMKKIFVLLGLLTALVANSAQAAAPTPQSVEKLLLLAKFGQMSHGFAIQIDNAIDMTTKRVLGGHAPNAGEKVILDDLKAQTKAVLNDQLSWDKIKGTYIRIYSDNFSQEQIDALIVFYQWPAGQAFAEHQPLIEQQLQGLLQPQMIPLTMKIQSLIRDAMFKLREAMNAAAAAAAKPPTAPAAVAAPAASTGSAAPKVQATPAAPKP